MEHKSVFALFQKHTFARLVIEGHWYLLFSLYQKRKITMSCRFYFFLTHLSILTSVSHFYFRAWVGSFFLLTRIILTAVFNLRWHSLAWHTLLYSTTWPVARGCALKSSFWVDEWSAIDRTANLWFLASWPVQTDARWTLRKLGLCSRLLSAVSFLCTMLGC